MTKRERIKLTIFKLGNIQKQKLKICNPGKGEEIKKFYKY